MAAVALPDRNPRPPRLALRIAAVAALVVLLGAVHVRRPASLCLLRGVTGVPCPFCGGTTAAVHLGRGDPLGALAASPLGVLTVLALPFHSHIRARLRGINRSVHLTGLAALLLTAEVWQLIRFGLLSP